MDFLALGSTKDPHIQSVASHLNDRGLTTIIAHHESAGGGASLLFELITNLRDKSEIYPFKCVWFRAKHVAKGQYALDDYRIGKYAERQWLDVYENIITLFERCALEKLRDLRRASQKLLQLSVAKNLNLNTPKSAVVFNKEQLEYFVRDAEALILKPLGNANLPKAYLDATPRIQYEAVLPKKLTRDEVPSLRDEDIASCPVFTQVYVEKKHEYRIVYVDGDIYPFSIDSQAKPYTQTDWRMGNMTLDFEPCTLPDDIVDKLHLYMGEMGIKFGSFDFIHTPDDEFVFLECNPEGQWAWLDKNINGAISKSYAQSIQRFIQNNS